MPNALLAALSAPVMVSYCILIQNIWKMLCWLPRPLLWWFLLEFLFKIDAKFSTGSFVSSCGGLLLNYFSRLMPNALPHPVVVSH
jgi:hypothetical protein